MGWDGGREHEELEASRKTEVNLTEPGDGFNTGEGGNVAAKGGCARWLPWVGGRAFSEAGTH